MYICIYEEYYGIDETLERAHAELQDNYNSGIDFEDISWYEAREIKVKNQITKVVDKEMDLNIHGDQVRSKGGRW